MTAKRATLALHATVLVATLIAGLSLFWPSLDQGVFADDFVALAIMDGTFAAPRGPLDLFNFVSGSAEDVAAVKRLGSVPWWAPDNLRVSFMRPLSSALWHLDRALFGDWYVGYHAHSLFAWALLSCTAALLFRVLLPWHVALLALPMFALDHSLQFPAIWLSNRGGLYATALGAFALSCHIRGRERSAPRWLALSALLWAVALAFGEWAFPMLAYVLAYELFDHGLGLGTGEDPQRDAWRTRVAAVAPAALLGLAFIVLRAKLGYGAKASGAYVDPADETGLFIDALLGRVPVFIADMLFNVPSSWWDHGSPWRDRVLSLELISPQLWMRMPPWPFFHALLGITACVLVAVVSFALVRKLALPLRRRMTFLITGALMSLVPVVGSFPSTRLTMAAFIGFAPLIALTLDALAARAYRMGTRSAIQFTIAYASACAIVWLQLVAPLTEDIGAMVDGQRATVRWVARAPLEPERVREQRVYLLASAEFTTTFYFAYTWSAQGKPLPRSVVPLIAAPYAFDVERTGDRTISIQTLGGGLLTSGQETMFRSARAATHVDEVFQVAGASVRVLREQAGEAEAIEVAFDRSLDDPSVLLLVAKREGFARWSPPPIGATLRVMRAAGPSWPGLEHARGVEQLGPTPEVVGYRPTPSEIAFDPDH